MIYLADFNTQLEHTIKYAENSSEKSYFHF